MKMLITRSLLALALISLSILAAKAQTTGAISGRVADDAGAMMPDTIVVVKGESGQEYTVTTTGNGTYNIPAVASCLYTVTISSPNFKTSVVQNVKVDVGTPSTVDVTLQTGDIAETVVVTGGAEVLQTQTATIGSTIQGRQIVETPI